jgi:hypothetical protein
MNNIKIFESLSDEDKIKLTMVKLDLEDNLTIDNEIYDIELYQTPKNTIGINNDYNILGMDLEIMFITENANTQLNKICDVLNRLTFCEAHFDDDQLNVAFDDEEDWVQITLYIVINSDYVFDEYDLEWFDIEDRYINRNANFGNKYDILNFI